MTIVITTKKVLKFFMIVLNSILIAVALLKSWYELPVAVLVSTIIYLIYRLVALGEECEK